jgi:hypothetical protein
MIHLTCGARLVTLALAAAMCGCIHTPPVPDMSNAVESPMLEGHGPGQVSIPFILDDNRILVELTFLKPDGSERKTLGYVNMGQGPMYLSNALFRDLAPDQSHPLRLRIGGAEISEDGSTVQPESMFGAISLTFSSSRPTPATMAKRPAGPAETFFAPMKVEAVIPAGVLEHFEVVFDYGARSMTLAAPSSLKPEGVAVPIRVNPKSGFVSVDAVFDGTSHPLVVDNGGSYTLFHDVTPSIQAHPERLRSIGGIGAANYVMSPSDILLPVVKIPKVSLGRLPLEELGGAQMVFPGLPGKLAGKIFWDWYSQKAGETTEGMIGGNVLKSFRLTLDYRNHVSYWLAEQPLDTHDLDQVGIVLARTGTGVTIAGIAQKNGADTVAGVEKGDKLLKIGDLDVSTATPGQIVSALHGQPGDHRHLTLDRKGQRIDVDAVVTGF